MRLMALTYLILPMVVTFPAFAASPTSLASPAQSVTASTGAGPNVILVHDDGEDDDDDGDQRQQRHRHGHYVDAPYTRVEAGRSVTVDAPFAHVDVNRRGRRIVAPFVDIWIPRR